VSLRVQNAIGLCTVQDLGRPGRMHEAVPPGGALVPERLIAANRTAGNPDDAPAFEILGQLALVAEAPVEVASDTGQRREVGPGGVIVQASEPRRVAYLAVRGGIAAPLVLGGRGTLLCAGLGGLIRGGQRFEVAGLPEGARIRHRLPLGPPDDPIRIVPGPDGDAFAPEALPRLLASEYRIQPSSNRVGTRLDGPPLPRSGAPEVSRPMVLGAIEVPRDGQPIVLGPEHPTTGGYPIIAVVARADLGRLFSIRLGGNVRFTR
jgi:allophanate hydrolase subunit 2